MHRSMEIVSRFILRRRVPLLVLMAAITIFFGSYLVPIKKIRFDFSFQRLFVQYGGDWGVLKDFARDFGTDVAFNAVVFIAGEGEGPLSGTVMHPAVLRRLEQVEEDLEARPDVEPGGVSGFATLPDLYSDPIEQRFCGAALERYDAARARAGPTAPGEDVIVACVEGRGPCEAVPAELQRAAKDLSSLGDRLRTHRLYTGTLVSEDLKTAVVTARYGHRYGSEDLRRPLVHWMRAQQEAWAADLPAGTRVELTGVPVIQEIYTETSIKDLLTFTPIASTAIALLLMWLFRWFWAMAAPLLTVHIAMIWGFGFMQLIGEPVNILNNVTPVIVLVIGVADGVHYVTRYIQEMRRRGDKQEALHRTICALGWACLLTSATTAVGFGSLLSASIPTIRSFGLYVAIAIMLAYVVMLVGVPIVLSYAPSPPERARAASSGGLLDRWLTWLALVTIRRRLTVTLVSLAVVAAAATGIALV